MTLLPAALVQQSSPDAVLFPVSGVKTRLLVLNLCLAFLPAWAAAQGPSTPEPNSRARLPMNRGTRSVGIWGGFSFESPGGDFLGQVTGREFLITGMRVGWIAASTSRFAVEYTFDLIPAAIVTDNPQSTRSLPDGEGNEIKLITGYGPVYGFGVSPIGCRMHAKIADHVRLFGGGGGGFLVFLGEVPLPDSGHLNFTFEFGGGLDWMLEDGTILSAGYKFHHLSNGGTEPVNPGLDASIYYLGLSWMK